MPPRGKGRGAAPDTRLETPDISEGPGATGLFDQGFAEETRSIVSSGLNPSSALDLVTRMIAAVPNASKEAMEHIKVLDKLVNTGRAMMETKLKTEEAAAIASRLDELERRVQGLFTNDPTSEPEITEDVDAQ